MPRFRKSLFRFLSSLRLAVILLAVLIIATAIGTICESRFDAKVARAYIYEAPWFDVWMIFLAINLAAAAFSRYPWKKHHTGFVITHAGIITLLVGAVVGRIWGIEGTMTLFEGTEPSNRLVIDEQEVQIQEGSRTATFPLGIAQRRARPDRPMDLGVTPGGWRVAVTDYAELLQAVPSPQAVTSGGAPAVQIRLWSGAGREVVEWLWPDDPEGRLLDLGLLAVECRHGVAPPPLRKAEMGRGYSIDKVSTASGEQLGDRAVIYLADDGKLSYTIQNKEGEAKEGDLKAGEAVATSWGDWQLEVAQVLPDAMPSTDFKPVGRDAKLAPRDRANCTEGVKVRISRGEDHAEEWLASGWQVELPTEGETLQASFGPKVLPLPISLKLQDFAVERNEGNDSPAGFKSTLLVSDAAGNSATGSCSMNEPMNFPDTAWRRWTGLTYKISQASWNPQNLAQSSVQILLDPGWLFKWSGSLMVCAGIFTMFYLRPPRDAAHP